MFNSPILDIAIGLIFIFLLYSLLATSIHEAVATLLSLRASMLRKSIIENMLSDTPLPSRFRSFIKGFKDLARSITRSGKPKTSLGWKFYAHPVIKNYGESGMFPLPSYIPPDNFSAVLIDILLKDFDDNIAKIATRKIQQGETQDDQYTVEADLRQLANGYKIRELLQHHLYCYTTIDKHRYYIECDICRILDMHLRNSLYDLDAFGDRLEKWFDDSMHRVSGWYKRQTQFILFIIGFILAFLFNVDTIEIAGRLTTDKDAREKLVMLASKATESYKDDPRVKQISAAKIPTEEQVQQFEQVKKEYTAHVDEARRLLTNDIREANNLLSVGWNGFGRNDSLFLTNLRAEKHWLFGNAFIRSWQKSQQDTMLQHQIKNAADKYALMALEAQKSGTADNLIGVNTDTAIDRKIMTVRAQQLKSEIQHIDAKKAATIDSLRNAAYYKDLVKNHSKKLKLKYVKQKLGGSKILGFLIMAFAICLGAPFWFDLLNKLVRIRGTGDKESAQKTPLPAMGTPQQPLAVTVNNQQGGEEAVG